ncbi:glycerol acyltransferase [Mycolicibacterium cosmeticum]|uniref:Phospholipid/glycerol acyltransferase n=1 Tax=Mycolicibacterium cosmeticum TaxID=258533 RepID=W9APE2_MYCCO|nr:lysophospholipid acyltransferase family protein [Mycolicibacterium cosmeticum]TLH80768.1 glycerol acyltransferase [Mycolicibacterium cosmeticum]CDO07609.1 phospholipid/glycerol acyltransferase [Mycolicibacterium cosmeticum]
MSAHIMTNVDALLDPPTHIRALRRAAETVVDAAAPLVDLYRPYLDGLHNLPRDGRFLLVGNHSQAGVEAFLIPFVVRRELGMLVRPLTDRGFGKMPFPAGEVMAAFGATVGSPESARQLMRHDQPILVFPGGGREIAKFKGEQNTLRWEGRAGFARVAVEHDYPIVPAALLGGDDVYTSLTRRDGRWGRFSQGLAERFGGKPEMAMPLLRGVGPTLIPRPQRMYLGFAAPIDTTKSAGIDEQTWVATVRDETKKTLERTLQELQAVRAEDPYRELNPLAWSSAAQPV